MLVTGPLIFSISSWFRLGRFYFSKKLFISSRLSILLVLDAVVISYDPLYFCDDGCNFSCFVSWILLIGVLSLFFLLSLAKGLSTLLIISKHQLLVSLIFSVVFFVSIWFILSLILMISFLLLTLVLVCSSLSGFRCKVRCFFELFLISEVGSYCYTLSS